MINRVYKKELKKRLKKIVVMLKKGSIFAPANGKTIVIKIAKVH